MSIYGCGGLMASAAVRGVMESVGQLHWAGERHFVVAVDFGDGGPVEPAAHPWVPERWPGRHRLVVGKSQEAGGQLAVYWAAQFDGFEHRPVGVGDQPLEAVPC